MCTGAMILFGIKRCVMGENDTFVGEQQCSPPRRANASNAFDFVLHAGGEGILHDHGELISTFRDPARVLSRSSNSHSLLTVMQVSKL